MSDCLFRSRKGAWPLQREHEGTVPVLGLALNVDGISGLLRALSKQTDINGIRERHPKGVEAQT